MWLTRFSLLVTIYNSEEGLTLCTTQCAMINAIHIKVCIEQYMECSAQFILQTALLVVHTSHCTKHDTLLTMQKRHCNYMPNTALHTAHSTPFTAQWNPNTAYCTLDKHTVFVFSWGVVCNSLDTIPTLLPWQARPAVKTAYCT